MKKRGLMGLLAVGLLVGLLLPASGLVLADEPICGSTYATDVEDYWQGTEKDGSPVGGVDAFRTDPSNATGPLVLDPLYFFSLGRDVGQEQGGWIVLEFPTYVGTCLTIVEASPTVGAYPEEKALVYVSGDSTDPENWTLLGEASNLAPDLGTTGHEPLAHPTVFPLEECIKFVKIVDITPWNSHPYGVADGFDVIAVYGGLCVIDVAVDIKPTSCPNPLNVKSGGVLPVAILGTADFDVTQIDPASVLLEGVSPLRWDIEDVATPFDGEVEDCADCTTEGPDGYADLTLKFKKQQIVAALGDVEDGDCWVLELTGTLKEEFGGTSIEGHDRMWIVNKGSGGPPEGRGRGK